MAYHRLLIAGYTFRAGSNGRWRRRTGGARTVVLATMSENSNSSPSMSPTVSKPMLKVLAGCPLREQTDDYAGVDPTERNVPRRTSRPCGSTATRSASRTASSPVTSGHPLVAGFREKLGLQYRTSAAAAVWLDHKQCSPAELADAAQDRARCWATAWNIR